LLGARACLASLALVLCTAQAPPWTQYPFWGPYTIVETGSAFPDRVFFAATSATLSPGSQQILRRWATFLDDHHLKVTLDGFADDPGDADANLELSARRVEVVRQALIALGTPAAHIKMHAYGNARPIVYNDDPAERSENRRVVAMPE
jgi:outer membrane protein OmpA-like peptidoglycan-associated protein